MKTMKQILPLSLIALIALSGCGAVKSTEEMGGKVDATNVEIKKTNGAVHNQTLAVALAEMEKPENSSILTPIPLGMLPPGEVFAKEATASEIVQLVYVLLKDVDAVPDESEKVNGEWTPETIKRIDHEKMSKFMVAMVIMGLAPQSTIQKMVRDQIVAGGRHSETTYKALMLRYSFTNDILLGQSLFTSKLANPGMLQEAVKYADNLNYISSLPNRDLFEYHSLNMLNPEENVAMKLSDYNTNDVWTKIDNAFDSELDERYKGRASKSGALKVLRAKVKSRVKGH